MARIAYESDLVTLWEGDCADVIADLPRDSVDLILTDPPYGVKWQSARRVSSPRFARIAGDDGTLDVPGVLGAASEALKDKRHAYVFGYAPEDIATPMRLGGTADLIWDKAQMGMGDLTQPWAPAHEQISFGVHLKSAAHRSAGYGNLAARMRRGSVIRIGRINGRAIKHPTEKPVALMRQLIESSSLPGDVVFDPFAGCGSTLVAAILTGRRALGVELDPGYVITAIDRIKRAEDLAAEIAAA